jgi:hypothetical protein
VRILFAGASGFGNLGDDAYRLAFARLVHPAHELRFDSPYPDPRAVDWADALVVGGGGLVYCNATDHWDYWQMYLERAEARGLPIAFCSVGVQLVGNPPTYEACLEQAHQIAPWAPWLRRACVVTVRSELDADVMQAAMGAAATRPKVHPDLCYTLTRPVGRVRLIEDGASVAVPTSQSWKARRGVYCDHFESAMLAGRPYYVVRMSHDDTEAVLQLEAEFGLHRGLEVLLNVSAPELVNSVLPGVHDVLTGRYHGMVLALAAGVPDMRTVDPRTKSRFEPQWAAPSRQARAHVWELEQALELSGK